MRVILTKRVKELGEAGTVAEVSEGYARNFLLPKGLAEEASGGKLRALQQADQTRKDSAKREELKNREKAKLLEGMVIEVPVKVGEGGKLFGSVTNREIAEVISQKLGEKLDRHRLGIEKPLRSLGNHRVTVKLAEGIEAGITVIVHAK